VRRGKEFIRLIIRSISDILRTFNTLTFITCNAAEEELSDLTG